MDEDLWDRLGAAADQAGTDRSTVLREFARWFTRESGARLPKRPPLAPLDSDGTAG
jgi:hypothetical protein